MKHNSKESSLASIALQMTSSLNLEEVLTAITQGLVDELDAAFARIWLLGPGDLCAECYKADSCTNRKRCLHLKASAGMYTRINGEYRRIPLGAFKIGLIAKNREPVVTNEAQKDRRLPNKSWLKENDLHSVAGYPLVFRDELIGVIAMFSRRVMTLEEFDKIAVFANQAAVAIKNGQLFEALKKSQHKNELILNSAGEGIYGLDLNGNTTFVNPAAARILGWQQEDLLGKPQHDLIHHTKPDGVPYPREECPIYAVFKDGLVHTVNNELFWRKDGTSLPVEYTSTPIRDDENNLVGAVVTFRDITERKNAEKELRESRARFSGILDIAREAIISTDESQRIIMFNKGAEEIFRYSQQEALGKSINVLIPTEFHEVHSKHITEFVSSDVTTRRIGEREEILGRRKNGEVFPAEASISKLQLGEHQILTVILRDISKRKQTEKALEQLRQKNELILRSAGEGIYGLDANGVTTFVNPAAAHILGWQPEDLLGKPQHDLIHHTRPDGSPYARENCPIYAAFKDGLVHTVDNELFWRKDGNSLPVEYTSTPIRDDENNLVGAVVTFRDITERKKAEKALRNALEEIKQLKERLQAENVYLQEEIKLEHNFDEIISTSKSFKKVLRNVEQVAATDATVLILGETGTGKELIARALHTTSPRKDRPLVKVNCAALPANLIESELFGHERGAFTGALFRKQGRFELADRGTIFLDEIGDLPLDLQAKLLRILQEGEFERVGGTESLKVDVRVIAATNRDLEQAVQSGEFREDLFYRMNVFPITLPPLRERREDVPLLINHFVKKYGAKMGKQISHVPQKAMETLQTYHFPGNVRELENIIERAIILAKGESLQLDESLELLKTRSTPTGSAATLEEVERKHIVSMLQETNWRIEGPKGAALRLGINPNTLRSRMQKLAIRKPS